MPSASPRRRIRIYRGPRGGLSTLTPFTFPSGHDPPVLYLQALLCCLPPLSHLPPMPPTGHFLIRILRHPLATEQYNTAVASGLSQPDGGRAHQVDPATDHLIPASESLPFGPHHWGAQPPQLPPPSYAGSTGPEQPHKLGMDSMAVWQSPAWTVPPGPSRDPGVRCRMSFLPPPKCWPLSLTEFAALPLPALGSPELPLANPDRCPFRMAR